jgi:hypothetical protein
MDNAGTIDRVCRMNVHSITPSGHVSIAVALAGEAAASIQP